MASQRGGRALVHALAARFADLVGHPGTTRTHRLAASLGGVLGRLVLHLGVDLSTCQNDDGREPHPHHEADHGTQRPVGGVIGAEIGDIPGQKERAHDPDAASDRAPPCHPTPLRPRAARPETVKTGKGQ